MAGLQIVSLSQKPGHSERFRARLTVGDVWHLLRVVLRLLAVQDINMSIQISHIFSLDLGIPGGPGRHGWSIDLGVFTVSLDFWNRFSSQFGSGTMDDSLDLWSLLEDVDTGQDTKLGSSLPLPSRPKSAPLQRDHPPQVSSPGISISSF